jgi:hypothetical protein
MDNSSTKDDVPESLVEVHGVGDGVVPLQGDHSCNIKGTVSRERNKCKIDQEVALKLSRVITAATSKGLSHENGKSVI